MIILPSSVNRILKHPLMLISILFLSLIGLGLYAILTNNNSLNFYGDYQVRLKINTRDDNMTDVYLYNEEIGSETKFLTIADVYRDHYHVAEFIDNTLYIIKRTDRSEGHLTNQDWSDELWTYWNDGRGKKLYSARGIDFRVMPEAKNIGVVSGTAMDETITVMNQDGNISKTFDRTNIGLENDDRILEPLFWKDGVFWLATRQGLILKDLISISAIDFSVIKRDVSDLNIAGHEFALNPTSKFLVFSDYVSPIDVQDINNIPSQSASLYLYDLYTGVKKILITAFTNRPFEPVWESISTIKYNDPNGQGKIKIDINASTWTTWKTSKEFISFKMPTDWDVSQLDAGGFSKIILKEDQIVKLSIEIITDVDSGQLSFKISYPKIIDDTVVKEVINTISLNPELSTIINAKVIE